MPIAPGKSPRPIGGAGHLAKEDVMRLAILACGLGVLALSALAYPSDPAAAAKSKMGCERGKEVWNARSSTLRKISTSLRSLALEKLASGPPN